MCRARPFSHDDNCDVFYILKLGFILLHRVLALFLSSRLRETLILRTRRSFPPTRTGLYSLAGATFISPLRARM